MTGNIKPIAVKFGLERVVANSEGIAAGTGMNLTLPF